MSSPRISISNRALAALLAAALVVSIGGSIISFGQLGGAAIFTGHAVADQADMAGDDAGISIADGDSSLPPDSSEQKQAGLIKEEWI